MSSARDEGSLMLALVRQFSGPILSLLLAVEMIYRASASQHPPILSGAFFQAATSLSPIFLLVGGLMIVVGHLLSVKWRPMILIATGGHILGCAFTAIYAAGLKIDLDWPVLFGALILISVLHLGRAVLCAEGALRWTR